MEMSEKAGFPLQQVFVMDGSKRSAHSNAFFTGFGKNKRIVLYDTLVEKHTTEELVAILAHEIGHYKKRHIVKGTIVSILHTGVLCFLMGLFLQWKPLFDAFFMEQMSVYAGLLFFGTLFSPLEAVLGPVMNAWSRKHEFEADAFAKTVVGSAAPLAEALKKLAVGNLSNATPHPFYVLLHYSHPPLVQRLEALETA
jgi:STE24 endopeptidase